MCQLYLIGDNQQQQQQWDNIEIEMNLISTLLILPQTPKRVTKVQITACPQIEQQLTLLLLDEVIVLKQAYSILEPVISIQSRLRGPRNFRKLLDEVFQFVRDYVCNYADILQSYDRIQAYEEHIVILNLTFYEKIFRFSLTPTQKIETLIIFTIANIHIFLRNPDQKHLNSACNKIDQMNALPITDPHFKNIMLLLMAAVTHLKGQDKRAKTMLGTLMTRIVEHKKDVLRCPDSLEILALGAYYSYENFSVAGEYELSCYYLTKAHEFGRKLGEKAINFTHKVKQLGEHKALCRVKLTRIQNKLQVLNRRKGSWHIKPPQSKIYNTKSSLHEQTQIKQQLKTIFTIKDTKATMYRFRKDNLRYLNSEEGKLSINIQKKQEELQEIGRLRVGLQAGVQVHRIQECIHDIKDNRNDIAHEYEGLKYKHLKQIKQVVVINKFMLNFLNLSEFKKLSYVYNFLYGQMFSRTKILILSLIMKLRVKLVKKYIKKFKITFRGLLHFCQIFQIVESSTELLIYKKKEPGYYLKIYPIEKKPGIVPIEDEKKLTKCVYDKLKNVPLCYEFQEGETKLRSWNEFFGQKSFFTVHYVKKFIVRLTKKYKNKDHPQTYRILTPYLKFGNHVSIETKLFVCISQSQQSSNIFLSTQKKATPLLQASIYTIGGPRYHNSLYNLTINITTVIDSKTFLQEIGMSLIKQHFINNCQNNVKSLIKIQKFVKVCHCKKKVRSLRMKNKILAVVNGSDVITYYRFSTGKSMIIVQNLLTRDREMIETLMDLNSFKSIALVKDKLSKQKTCKDKLKMTCKYIWTRFFVTKLKDHIKKAVVMTDFQISFQNRFVFAKEFNSFIYKKKLVFAKIVFSLTVECLLEFPRPYVFRIYTVLEGSVIVDIVARIYNKEKLFYEKNLQILNRILNILSKSQMEIICQSQQIQIKGRHRNTRSSRASRISTSMLNSIVNLSSDDQIRTITQIVPKMATKKTSMLARFRNRRSNRLTLEPHAQTENQSQTFSNYSAGRCGETQNNIV